MPDRLHLVRHGEVHNPGGVVYADLPGFGLSTLGRSQAEAAGRHLAGQPLRIILASPLDRAVETAAIISGLTGTGVSTEDRLTEWGLGRRWAGTVWDELPLRFPGELEAYLATPTDLAFSPESIGDVADRMTAVVDELARAHPDGDVVLVSHQDPVQALRLRLTGRALTGLQDDKPGHACVITLIPRSDAWAEAGAWCPEQSEVPFPPITPEERRPDRQVEGEQP